MAARSRNKPKTVDDKPMPQDYGSDNAEEEQDPRYGTLSADEIQNLIDEALSGEGGPDLSDYAQTADIQSLIDEAIAGQESPDLSGYAETGDIQSLIDSAIAAQGLDLSGYAETGDMEKAIEAALAGQGGPDLSGYAETADIQDMIDAAIAGQDEASGEGSPDLSSAFLNPDGTLKDEYLQGIGDQIQGLDSFAGGDMDAAIAAAMQDFNIDDQVGDAMKLWGDDFKEQFGANYMEDFDISQYVTEDMIQKMIANAQLQGMDEAAIRDMIKNVMGDSMSDEDITAAIEAAVATSQEGMLTPEEIQTMIDEGLANGMSPEEIQDMIEQYAGGMDPAVIAQMIADAQANIGELGGLTAQEIQDMIDQGIADGLTAEEIQALIAEATGGTADAATIQQMIDDAIAAIQTGGTGIEGMSTEDIQALLDSGYMTADQINSLLGESGGRVDQLTGELGGRIDALTSQLGESGFLGQEGVDSSVAAALQAALGEGGSINSAIAAAMQGAGGGDSGGGDSGGGGDNSSPLSTVPVDTSFNFGEYNPGSFPTNPYGDVNPYDLMNHPYSSAITGGIGGIAGLDLGNPGAYNFDMPTSTEPVPTGIPSYQDYMQYLAAQQTPAPQAPQKSDTWGEYGPNGEVY